MEKMVLCAPCPGTFWGVSASDYNVGIGAGVIAQGEIGPLAPPQRAPPGRGLLLIIRVLGCR